MASWFTPLYLKLSIGLSFLLMSLSHVLSQYLVFIILRPAPSSTRTAPSSTRPAPARTTQRVSAPQMRVPETRAD